MTKDTVHAAVRNNDAEKALLPGLLGRIEALTSTKTALVLALNFGGTKIKIPARDFKTSKLADLIGADAVEAIAAGIGPGELWIPCGDQAGAGRRRQLAREMTAKGASAAEIARVVGITDRTVHRVRSRDQSPKAAPLLDLIDKQRRPNP